MHFIRSLQPIYFQSQKGYCIWFRTATSERLTGQYKEGLGSDTSTWSFFYRNFKISNLSTVSHRLSGNITDLLFPPPHKPLYAQTAFFKKTNFKQAIAISLWICECWFLHVCGSALILLIHKCSQVLSPLNSYKN